MVMKNKYESLKPVLSFVLSLLFVFCLLQIEIGVHVSGDSLSNDIVILYTNDVHSYIDGTLSYDVISGIKKDLETKYKYVLLVDAGDHAQGTAYGSMDKGKTVVKLMNEAGYDAATLGNHEFDYGMQGCMDIINSAEYEYVSCNFYYKQNIPL